jgi:hypothetical protein
MPPCSARSLWFSWLSWFSWFVLLGPSPETSQNELAESSNILTSTARRFVTETWSVHVTAAVG